MKEEEMNNSDFINLGSDTFQSPCTCGQITVCASWYSW